MARRPRRHAGPRDLQSPLWRWLPAGPIPVAACAIALRADAREPRMRPHCRAGLRGKRHHATRWCWRSGVATAAYAAHPAPLFGVAATSPPDEPDCGSADQALASCAGARPGRLPAMARVRRGPQGDSGSARSSTSRRSLQPAELRQAWRRNAPMVWRICTASTLRNVPMEHKKYPSMRRRLRTLRVDAEGLPPSTVKSRCVRCSLLQAASAACLPARIWYRPDPGWSRPDRPEPRAAGPHRQAARCRSRPCLRPARR